MGTFWINVNGVAQQLVFSLCRNGRWLESPTEPGRMVGIAFDYPPLGEDDGDLDLGMSDLEDMGEAGDMLLQVLNLRTT